MLLYAPAATSLVLITITTARFVSANGVMKLAGYHNHQRRMMMSNLVKTLKATAPHYQCAKLLNEAADFIEQQQQRIEELEQRNNELTATVERLHFIVDTEYADEDERIADIQGVLELTPQQNLAEQHPDDEAVNK